MCILFNPNIQTYLLLNDTIYSSMCHNFQKLLLAQLLASVLQLTSFFSALYSSSSVKRIVPILSNQVDSNPVKLPANGIYL